MIPGNCNEANRAAYAYFDAAQMMALLVQALVYTALALLVSWQATAAALLVGGILMSAMGGLVRRARQAGARQSQLTSMLVTYLTDVLQSVKPLKAMGREDLADGILARQTRQIDKALRKQVIAKESPAGSAGTPSSRAEHRIRGRSDRHCGWISVGRLCGGPA